MSEIKAIETRYKGYRFRSRLEARWAVAFASLGIKWNYEPEGFDVCGRLYLPDFFLPDLDLYVEVKANAEAAAEHDELFNNFSEHVGPIIVVVGVPFERFGRLYSLDTTCSSGGHADFDAILDVVDGNPTILFVSGAHSDCRTLWTTSYTGTLNAIAYAKHSLMKPSRAWYRAQDAARSARFEHGEAPR